MDTSGSGLPEELKFFSGGWVGQVEENTLEFSDIIVYVRVLITRVKALDVLGEGLYLTGPYVVFPRGIRFIGIIRECVSVAAIVWGIIVWGIL